MKTSLIHGLLFDTTGVSVQIQRLFLHTSIRKGLLDTYDNHRCRLLRYPVIYKSLYVQIDIDVQIFVYLLPY